jgi:hypothetical protein
MPVTSVSDLINLLAARRQVSILHDRRTGMPYSWSNWLQTRVSAAISAFTHADVVTTAAAKPAAPSTGVALVVPLWRTMLLMFWHGGDPPPRDQRGLRWFAGFCSAGLHLLFAMLLLWAALVSSNVPDDSADEGARVQVEYVGRGTPQEEGGGTPEASAASAGQAATAGGAVAATAEQPAQPSPVEPASAAAQSAVAAPATAEDAAESMSVDAYKPVPLPEPAADQPLQVTETTRPTSRFVVPPPAVAAPTLRSRAPQVQERTVETAADRPQLVQSVRAPVEVQPQVRVPQVQVRERQIEVAPQQPVVLAPPRSREVEVQVRSPELGVAERQVETAPQQSVAMAAVRSREITSQVSAPQLAVRERQLPGVPDAPPATPKAGSGSAVTTAAGNSRADAATQTAGASTTRAATADGPRSGTSAGAGPKPQDRSGGWAAPTRGDDWGASQRTVAGNAGGQADKGEGLFNADGTVRLAGSDGQGQEAARGAPGGEADSWSRERIAQSGTWLKRPPYDYTPTSFDKYWVPSESLLAEWVRKGIKDIEIPIPGSTSKISCVVSLLQFGGGCGLTNPNMQEQPAQARPPPDIPFKKELQEDNGSR